MPDTPEVWVQGKVTGRQSTVSTFVNDGEPTRMNRRGDDFGFHISLDNAMNAVVVIASDATGQNRSAKLVKVERSDKYRAEVKLPPAKYYGKFTNGEAQPVTGFASYRFDDSSSDKLTLVSVKVNGMAASMSGVVSNGFVNWSGVTLPAPGCKNSVVPIIVSLCWSGEISPNTTTNICVNVPLDFIEGYEI